MAQSRVEQPVQLVSAAQSGEFSKLRKRPSLAPTKLGRGCYRLLLVPSRPCATNPPHFSAAALAPLASCLGLEARITPDEQLLSRHCLIIPSQVDRGGVVVLLARRRGAVG